jgi:hypothetical protein
MSVQVDSPRSTILKSLRVEAVLAARVTDLIESQHYLHSMPSVTRECFAVVLGDVLVGAAVFTQGGRHAHRVFQGTTPAQVITLARFWMADGLPGNNESRVLGIVLRLLARQERYKFILSYADPAAGHVGIIYQATGWLYLGQTEPERSLIIDGRPVHPRTASTRYGSNSIAHLRRTGVPVTVKHNPPKHRYAYVLDRSWAWRIRAQVGHYPKSGGRDPPRSRTSRKDQTKRPVGGIPPPHRPRTQESPQ